MDNGEPNDLFRTETSRMNLAVEAYVRGGPPPEELGCLYYGSLTERVLENSLLMIDFVCDNFDLFKTDSDRSAEVTLADGPVRSFKIFRMKGGSAFQFQLPSGFPHGETLVRAVAEMREVMPTLKEPGTLEVVDPLIGLVRGIFSALRNEGDIGAQPCVISEVAIWSHEPETKTTHFQSAYLGMSFTV